MLAASVGCGGDLGFPPAAFENEIDTLVLAALTGTPVNVPSGYDLVAARRARTDLNEEFDFAFEIDSTDTGALLTSTLVGRRTEAGIVPLNVPFDSIFTAPEEGYVTDSVVTVGAGDTFVARSRFTLTGCTVAASLPRYGKFEVLAIDLQERTVEFKMLVNVNCGYRDLEPGIPTS